MSKFSNKHGGPIPKSVAHAGLEIGRLLAEIAEDLAEHPNACDEIKNGFGIVFTGLVLHARRYDITMQDLIDEATANIMLLIEPEGEVWH